MTKFYIIKNVFNLNKSTADFVAHWNDVFCFYKAKNGLLQKLQHSQTQELFKRFLILLHLNKLIYFK